MKVRQRLALPALVKAAGVAAAALLVASGLVGCARGTEPASPSPPSADGSASVSPAPSPASPVPSAPSSVTAWTSEPVTVTKDIAVPPVPRLLRIRSAPHTTEGFDRIVFDFEGVLPGYAARYVDEVIADASGEPVDVPGRRFLQLTFRPAQAHNDAGTESVTPRSMELEYPMMEGYAIVGDFEATLTVVIGLDDVVGYRIGELPGTPGRIYVDVAA